MQQVHVVLAAATGLLALLLQGCFLMEVTDQVDAGIRFYCEQRSYNFVESLRLQFEQKLQEGCKKTADLKVKGNNSLEVSHKDDSSKSHLRMGAYIDLQVLQCEEKGLEELELAFQRDYKKAVDQCVLQVSASLNTSSFTDWITQVQAGVNMWFDGQLNMTASFKLSFDAAIHGGFSTVDGAWENATASASGYFSSKVDFFAGYFCDITSHDIRKTVEVKWEEMKRDACSEINATLQKKLSVESTSDTANSSLKVGFYVEHLRTCEDDVVDKLRAEEEKLSAELKANCTAYIKGQINVSKVMSIMDVKALTKKWESQAVHLSASWEAEVKLAITTARNSSMVAVQRAEADAAMGAFQLGHVHLGGMRSGVAGATVATLASAAAVAAAAAAGLRRLGARSGEQRRLLLPYAAPEDMDEA